MKTNRVRAAAIVVLVAASSCTTGDDNGAGATVRDTVIAFAGSDVTVSIVDNGEAPAALPEWTVSPEPVLDLGGADAPEEETLFRIASAVRLSDGRIIVGDGGSSSLKVFTAAGDLAGSIGRPGQGPGEFRAISFLALRPGDSVAVWDFNQARLTVFDADGEVGRETRIGSASDSPMSDVVGIFGDGSLLSRDFVRLAGPPSGLMRHSVGAFHLSSAGTLVDSIPPIPAGEAWFVSVDGGFSAYTPPFARSTDIIVHGDRIIAGDTGHPEVRVLSADGTPRLLIRWADSPRRITADDIQRAKQASLGDDPTERTRTDVEDMYATIDMPAAMPAFGDVRVDVDGSIWVQEYRTEWEEGDVSWSVFDASGSRIATARLPDGFTPTHIGRDFVLGTATDDLDVEHVRLYRLQR